MTTLIEKLAIRQIEHRSNIHSNKPRHLTERTKVAHLQRRFSFVLQRALSFRTRNHLCRHRVALADTRQLRSQDPVPVHAHCAEEVTRSKGREGTNGDGNGDRDGDGAGTETGVETKDAHQTRTGTRAGTGTGREGRWIRENGRKTGTGTGTGAGTKTRAAKRQNGDRSGDGDWSGYGNGTRMERERERRRVRESDTSGKKESRGIMSVDRKWRLRIASSFGYNTRRLPDNVVPKGEPGTRDRSDVNRDGGGDGNAKENGKKHENRDRDGNEGERERGREWRGGWRGEKAWEPLKW